MTAAEAAQFVPNGHVSDAAWEAIRNEYAA